MPANNPQSENEASWSLPSHVQLAPGGFREARFAALGGEALLGEGEMLELLTWERWEWCRAIGIYCYDEASTLKVERLQHDIEIGTLVMPCTPREFKGWAEKLEFSLPPTFAIVRKSKPPSKTRIGKTERDDDKADCVRAAQKVWDESPWLSDREVKEHPTVAPYVRKYKGKNTVTGWIRPINPNRGRRGRRKKPEATSTVHRLK